MPDRRARAKLIALLAGLVAISVGNAPMVAGVFGLTMIAAIAGAVPIRMLLVRAALVLPFSALLALAALWNGGAERAAMLLARSYVSAIVVVLFSAATTVPAWTAELESWGVPVTLILILQFLHRYLFLIVGEARRMKTAARARGGFRFDAATGALGVLFARSWRRSEMVHRAMLARGFRGKFS